MTAYLWRVGQAIGAVAAGYVLVTYAWPVVQLGYKMWEWVN